MNEIHSIRNSYTGFPAKQRQSARIYPLGMLSRPLAALLLVLLILVNSSNCLPAVFASEQGLYSLVWSSLESEVTHNVAWADYDGDGDLDLAISNRDSSAIRLYRNNGDQLSPSADWSLSESGPHNGASIAWADVDDDGDLDIALGRWGAATRWYRSENGVLSTSPAWNSSSSQYTTNVAWGYLNNDNYPDLAISCENYGSGGIRVYTNNAGTLNSNPWVSPHDEPTRDLAWADIDKDGDLDLAAATGNEGFPKSNRLFRNDNGVLVSIWQSSESEISTGVAWGDFDGDGYPDLAVSNAGNPPTRIYQNISNGGGGRTLSSSGVWTAVGTNISYDVAWGDYDSDGDLDLITGTGAGGVYVYRNDGGSLGTSPVWFSPSASESTLTIALGDIDNDGDLDIAAGNGFGPNRLYRNHSTTLTNNAIWTSSLSDYSNSIAWGDVDHDGDLDLVVGGGCKFGSCNPSHLYQNNGGNLSLTVWFPSYLGQMRSVAWGDVDKDYDLELAVGNESGANYIFENSGSLLTNSPSWISSEGDPTQSVAWGDYDGDGDLDLAVGNGSRTNYSPDTYYGVPNRLYRNENGMLTASAVWSSAESDPTMEIAWGDYDADGDLDLVASNYLTPNRLYRNDHGILTTSAVWSSLDRDRTYGAAWSDYDGDGDLDLSVSNDAAPQKIYRNDGGVLSALATWTSVESLLARKIAWGDMDGDSDPDMLTIFHSNPSVALNLNDHGSISSFADWRLCDNCYSWYFWGGGSGDIDNDGDLDLAVANGAGIYDEYSQGHEMVFRNGRDSTHLPEAIPVVYIHQPGIYANYYATPFIWENQFIPISYTLSHSLSNPVKLIRAFYSLDGGGRWLPAIPTPATPIANLVTSPEGAEYLYNWDVFGSGFFGQSDNVVFRIEAVPAVINNPIQPPGFYRYSSYATQTYPFRVRGTQVRVISDTVPVPGALVYCLPAGQESGASLFSDLAGEPYRTDGQGYLQGRGQLGIGDQLVAMLPVTSTESYTLYHTSATPMASGLAMNEVTAAGVQTLTVTTENPLVLFDLDVSLQWDARYDHEYMAGLEYNLSRASELLYDWTDGQAALGEVRVFHNRQNWNDAHIRVYASNQLRPMALQGGIVGEVISDTQVLTMTYAPGQVHMGAMWSRYGGAGSSLGDDWPRALAH
ncbi:MAG: VCBS repeat-containing protein, partial [Anaerolineales bacterium]|nr:VCBS repeat-containing protein [Anaerolineales bacterium]